MGKKNEKSRGKLSANKRNELKVLSDAILVKSREKPADSNAEFENYNEIYNLLERIIKIESEIKLPFKSSRSEKSIENFIAWCRDEGAKFEKIELKSFQEFGLGLVAKKKLNQGDIFVEIPENMIFSYDKIENNIPEVLKKRVFIDCPLFENKSNVRLALALMIERMNSQSKYKPYFDVLPNKFSTVLYFTPADMKELQGTTAISSAIKQVKYISSQYAFLYKYLMLSATENNPVMEELRDNFTYEFYRWAVSCVMTRQNIIPRDDGNENVLIPAWDMANHTNGEINTQYNGETQRIESFCIRNFEAGEQVTIAYGNRSNLDFLVHNGFVFKDNTNNDLFIKVNLNKNCALFEDRVNLLKCIGLTDTGNFKISPEISGELLAFMRVFYMTKEQLDQWLKEADEAKLKQLFSKTLDLGKDLEMKILQSLLIRVRILLKLFPTDLTDDMALLSVGNLSKIKSMLVQYRILEKNILLQEESKLSEQIKELNSK